MTEQQELQTTERDGTAHVLPIEHQPSVEAAFDSAHLALSLLAGPRTCRRCLREGRDAIVTDPQAQVCPRCCSALKGNRRAQRHGLRSRPELHPDTAALFLERTQRVLADVCGDDPAYVHASQVRDYILLELLTENGAAAVVDEGASGKVIDQLVTIIATKARLAQQIGLTRRARDLSAMSPDQYVALHREQSEAPKP